MTGQFTPAFRDELAALVRWRRDVRRFRTDPVPEDLLARGLQAFALAPSVGLCEPWRVLQVTSTAARTACLDNFRDCNACALDGYDGDRLARDLEVPDSWRFIAYLCIGWPEEAALVPELEREGWERRNPALHLETR
jgi:nitroreductase